MAKKQKANLTLDEALSIRAQRRPELLKLVCEAACAAAAGKPYDGDAVVLALEELNESRSFFDAEVDLCRRRLGFDDLRKRLNWWQEETLRRGRIWRRVLFRADAMHKLIDLRVKVLRTQQLEALGVRNQLLRDSEGLSQDLLTAYERERVESAQRGLNDATDRHKRLQGRLGDLRSNVEKIRYAARFAEGLDRDTPEGLTRLVLPTSIFRSIPTELHLPHNGNSIARDDAAEYIEQLRAAADRYEAEAGELEPQVAAALDEIEQSRKTLEEARAAVPRFEVELAPDTEEKPVKRVFPGRVLDKAASILVGLAEENAGEGNPGGELLKLEQILEQVFAEDQADSAGDGPTKEPETEAIDSDRDGDDEDPDPEDEINPENPLVGQYTLPSRQL